MPKLKFVNVTKKYPNGHKAITNLSFEVEEKEFITVVGPSGSGKTTLLSLISGIESMNDGEIYIDDQLINDIPAKQRDIAVVLQNNALFPHMTIYENIAYGLKSYKFSKEETEERVNHTAELLQIVELLKNKPKTLSGGESQKVTIAKAIARRPRIFLMDEPLSNLDLPSRVQLRLEIMNLYENTDLTFFYVTHDQAEAMSLGTKMLVLKDGELQQFDTPKNIYESPVNAFVASFIGTPQINLIEAVVTKNQEKVLLKIGNYEILLPERKAIFLNETGYIDKEVIIGLRPQYFYIDEPSIKNSAGNIFKAKVTALEMTGADSNIFLKSLGHDLCITVKSDIDIKINDTIKFSMDLDKIFIFDKATGLTIA